MLFFFKSNSFFNIKTHNAKIYLQPTEDMIVNIIDSLKLFR